MTEHTIGDWIVTGFPGNDRSNPELSIIDDCGYAIATLEVDHKTNAEVIGNSKMIAAVPKLLAALKAFVEPWSRGGEWQSKLTYKTFDEARTAIAAATGEDTH